MGDVPVATDQQLSTWEERLNARNRAHVCSRLLRTIARVREEQALHKDYEDLVLEAADLRLEVAVLRAEAAPIEEELRALADKVEAVETALREIEELPGLLPPPKIVAEWGRLAGVEEAADIARTARKEKTDEL